MASYSERQAARKANIIRNAQKFHENGPAVLGILPVQFGRAGEIFADSFSAGADAFDQELGNFVERNPGVFFVGVATAANTLIEGILNPLADMGRLGKSLRDAQEKGTIDPMEVVNDAFRILTVITHTPEGKAAVQKLAGQLMTKLASKTSRLIRDTGGGICSWVAGISAMLQTGQFKGLLGSRLFIQLEDLAKLLKMRELPASTSALGEMLTYLEKLGAKHALPVEGKPGFITPAELARRVPKDGTVAIVSIEDVGPMRGPDGRAHAVMVFWENGLLKVMDRSPTGKPLRVFDSFGDFLLKWLKDRRYFQWKIRGYVLFENLFMKNVAGEKIHRLVLPLAGLLKIDTETALEAAAVQKAVDEGSAPVPMKVPPTSASAPIIVQPEPGVTLPPNFKVYTVQRGDSLSAIAKRFYGKFAKWPIIYVANKAIIGKNPNLIKPGQLFWIPEIKHR